MVENLRPKKVSESAIDNYPMEIFPNDLNPLKTVAGGRVLEIADRLAAIVARRHSQNNCVTLFLDSVRFLSPAQEAEILIFKLSANRSWVTSMEIGVKIVTEDILLKNQRHVASMYFTFVAVDSNNIPTPIPQLIPEKEEEKRRFREANKRRKQRLKS